MNVRLQYSLPFTAGVHYHDRLIMNTYLLKVFMITNTAEAESNNVAFERLKYFINEEMDSTIFVNIQDQEVCKRYMAAGIKITTIHNEPVDQILGVMLFHKLNAIMEDRITVLETELSSHLGDNMVYIHSENEYTQNLESSDWWTTSDVVHCDLAVIDQDNVVAMHRGLGWRELDLSWPGHEEEIATGNIVFADFGKDETR